jgi:hypothetical protein
MNFWLKRTILLNRPGGQLLVVGKNLSRPIVSRVTEIVNWPFVP